MENFAEKFETFTSKVASVYKCIQKIKSREAKSMGIKGSHITCLYYLGRCSEGLTAAALCRLCDLDKAAVSRIIAELTDWGYIVSRGAKANYRAPIQLTENGRKVNDQINKAINRAVEKATEGIDDADRARFYHVFFTIAENLLKLVEQSDFATDFC